MSATAIVKIFEGLIEPEQGDFSPAHAQYVLGLKFTDDELARYQLLGAKNGEGTLTPAERSELEAFAHAEAFLSILKMKARRSLLQNSSAA